jgi:hypothetical protein
MEERPRREEEDGLVAVTEALPVDGDPVALDEAGLVRFACAEQFNASLLVE